MLTTLKVQLSSLLTTSATLELYLNSLPQPHLSSLMRHLLKSPERTLELHLSIPLPSLTLS
jgi:hypothetical protein